MDQQAIITHTKTDELPEFELEIRSAISGGFKLKYSSRQHGMYMDGIRATQSTRGTSGWWVQPPAIKDGSGKWNKCPEFDQSGLLWQAIEAKAIELVVIQTETPRQEARKPRTAKDAVYDMPEGLEDWSQEKRDGWFERDMNETGL